MGAKGGCCMARSARYVHDGLVANRAILRYRPIAPKPAGADSIHVRPGHETNNAVVNGKGKRKCIRVRKRKQYRRKERAEAGDSEDGVAKKVATLQLLPEKSEAADGCRSSPNRTQMTETGEHPPVRVGLNSNYFVNNNATAIRMSDPTTERRVVESWVTLECVTDLCVDGGELGLSDAEKVKNLEEDKRPGFVSDGFGGVKMVNGAYKDMVVGEEEECFGAKDCVVWLVMKDKLPYLYLYPAFACIARLQYTWRNCKCSRTVPCDVWRMDGGGFAWRLDVQAALSLGR